ncbi:MAG: nucleotidyltransferase family protein [Candidatus Omnitrophota bacterium]
MKILILAAGYGTRLYPLTLNAPKPLLAVNKKPIIDYLLEKTEKISGITEVLVVTNEKFYSNFTKWSADKKYPLPITIVNDTTTSPEDRLGAVGDIAFVLRKRAIKEDLMVLGGDNLFDYALISYIRAAGQNSPRVTIGLFDIKDPAQAKQFGVVGLDENNKITSFEEKPQQPKSSLIAMCLYYFPKESLGLFEKYLQTVKKTDTTGEYIKWIAQQEAVFGYKFSGKWYDIGSMESYTQAQKDFS